MLKVKLSFRHLVILFYFIICMVGCTVNQDSHYNYEQTVHTFNEAWNTGNYNLLDKSVHPDYLEPVRLPSGPDPPRFLYQSELNPVVQPMVIVVHSPTIHNISRLGAR